MAAKTNAQTKIDDNDWLIHVKESLDILQEVKEEGEEFSVSIFNVPKELLAQKPEAYTPQSVSIGPYHHWRSELYDMERYKLAAARRFQKRINGHKFEAVAVEEFKKWDLQIRSCYHNFIDYKDETFAWIMALDATFLLECLQFYVRHADKSSDIDIKQLGRVLHPTGTGSTHNSIFRDLMMLENQLPLFLLQSLLELQLGSRAKAEERLSSLLRLVCQELSPFSFKLPEDSKLHINEKGHVLEVLYYAIVPASSNQNLTSTEEGKDTADTENMSTVTQAFSLLWKTLSSIKVGPFRFLTDLPRRLLNGRPLRFLMKLPLHLLSIIGNLPALSALKKPLSLFVDQDEMKSEEEDAEGAEKGEGQESTEKIIPPTRDELAIPSVAALSSAGVKFVATDGDLTTIQFDEKTATIYLPKVRLDANTEVILTNLAAFESSAAPGALVFARYTDFINGMIDNEEDVRLLKESGIITNHLRNDGEVASLWNSMGKCIPLTKVAYLDKVIKDINNHYNRKWNVAVVEFLNERVFGSWKFLSLVAAAILLAVIRNVFLATEEGFMSLVTNAWSTKPQLAAVGSCCLVGLVYEKTLYVANMWPRFFVHATFGSLSYSFF